jgi:hypothetical protein
MLYRPLFCPICGASLMVEVPDTKIPEVHRLPDHKSANGMNLCSGFVITVTIGWDQCSKCGQKMGKHPSGLCQKCFEISA